jgi:hypothetical protein
MRIRRRANPFCRKYNKVNSVFNNMLNKKGIKEKIYNVNGDISYYHVLMGILAILKFFMGIPEINPNFYFLQ